MQRTSVDVTQRIHTRDIDLIICPSSEVIIQYVRIHSQGLLFIVYNFILKQDYSILHAEVKNSVRSVQSYVSC